MQVAIFNHLLAIFLGGQFLVFGLNGFFNFVKIPAPPKEMADFLFGLGKAKYLMTSVKLLEIISGALILWPSTRLLGLLLLAPVIFNIIGIQVEFNLKKSWIVLLQVLLPYLLLLGLGFSRLLAVLGEVLQLA